ncbi:hypothetical protein B5807_07972 [Epicoccum nigrum]|uniref:Uncharacterized protein n=1 Tax=Epicoccum nigrum TaxID=105696 RepID=A0A1Y2LX31_EPING|nr:hypothetical protein B5807_07972 [Epicoccum nigrum]
MRASEPFDHLYDTRFSRKNNAGSPITKTSGHVNNRDNKDEHPLSQELPTGGTDFVNIGYANVSQSLVPGKRGELRENINEDFEFKEAGLMKKTISVRYRGIYHHVISYYSLEDVLAG